MIIKGYLLPGNVVALDYKYNDKQIVGWSYTVRRSDELLNEYHTYQLFSTPSEAKEAMLLQCIRSGNQEIIKRKY